MAKSRKGQDPKLQAWVAARKKHGLSHAHVQMARELGLNPKKLGKLATLQHQPWKAPLAEYIQQLYEKSFKRRRPTKVMSIEEVVVARDEKRAKQKREQRARQASREERGAVKALRAVLEALMRSRFGGFGELPSSWSERLQGAGVNELTELILRAADAPELDAVLAERPKTDD